MVNDNLVSIIIPAYLNSSNLWDCLKSLNGTSYPSYEFIIMGTKGSFAHNVNRGIQASRGKYICLLNDDTKIIQAQWLTHLVELMESDEKIAAVSPMMVFPDGQVQFGGMVFHPHYLAGHLGFKWSMSDKRLHYKPTEFQATTFGCVLLRREALETLQESYGEGIFLDEAYKVGGFEDVDTCFRLKLNGWKIFYQPASIIQHKESQTFRQIDQGVRKEAYNDNMKLYLSRWQSHFEKGTFRVDDLDHEGGRIAGTWELR